MKYKSSSEKAAEQGLGRTCVEDTNASYTYFNLGPRPLKSPTQSPGLDIPSRQRRNIQVLVFMFPTQGYYPHSPFFMAYYRPHSAIYDSFVLFYFLTLLEYIICSLG